MKLVVSLLSITLISMSISTAKLLGSQAESVLSKDQSIHEIKQRLGHLVEILLKRDDRVHPHEIIKLCIYYLELYLSKEHNDEVQALRDTLKVLTHEKDAQILLTTLQEHRSVPIFPDSVQNQIASLSNNQMLLLYNHIKKELKKYIPSTRPLHEIAEKAFHQCC